MQTYRAVRRSVTLLRLATLMGAPVVGDGGGGGGGARKNVALKDSMAE